MADFIDFFVIGEGEEVLVELLDSFRQWKIKKAAKEELLRQVAAIPGVYVPSLYQVEYQADGLIKSITPTAAAAKPTIERRIVAKLPPPVTRPVVPYIEVVHDRGRWRFSGAAPAAAASARPGLSTAPCASAPSQR